jgi:hypothetical protein
MVIKVSRRLAPRNRRRSKTNNKEANGNNDNQQQDNQDNGDVDQSQTRNAGRGRGRGRRGGYSGGGYFMDQGRIDINELCFIQILLVIRLL